MIFDRVSEITGEKMDEKTIFELTKKPVNKEKSRAFGSAHPIWLHLWDEVGVFFIKHSLNTA
ncbi:MAG: hypothetical protein COU29_00410 [Candidatus Magasanikbacteria bacterium CG10_big_fil_rev_8_21_14_0_10_36_32]|uniref:Uncharacterized protein n=1 Tax=Candidatus Magasanikbacteria bacterium CG10_big_fil_rev_8_21_14_0_10_36_32 TaxID=1974646 RepID=A0A2M6W7Q1_9BACT|nr:MAG: hypothetical protein COU29_00410 [Candidatus Magasanikbacteria bacterium CG10_big_fil_rev_8_21_14_0_10_36_32]